ncbi:hypothetical protein C7974DRAFT_444736 [Boeremia exigua]|uniref:uncharacterized protein n=1 Tax=Boeremia exigua TaxID=749465 RepID=UPI001E8CB383|nr:uncharacterized protein C7974DRAFT_444736 [Boeremia exigua]KAH6613124.1 hypothetical protein C7974DRAFT_444736 [Boeremia exigua]
MTNTNTPSTAPSKPIPTKQAEQTTAHTPPMTPKKFPPTVHTAAPPPSQTKTNVPFAQTRASVERVKIGRGYLDISFVSVPVTRMVNGVERTVTEIQMVTAGGSAAKKSAPTHGPTTAATPTKPAATTANKPTTAAAEVKPVATETESDILATAPKLNAGSLPDITVEQRDNSPIKAADNIEMVNTSKPAINVDMPGNNKQVGNVNFDNDNFNKETAPHLGSRDAHSLGLVDVNMEMKVDGID